MGDVPTSRMCVRCGGWTDHAAAVLCGECDRPRPSRDHDYETPTVEAAARFEQNRGEDPLARDPWEIPSRDEL